MPKPCHRRRANTLKLDTIVEVQRFKKSATLHQLRAQLLELAGIIRVMITSLDSPVRL